MEWVAGGWNHDARRREAHGLRAVHAPRAERCWSAERVAQCSHAATDDEARTDAADAAANGPAEKGALHVEQRNGEDLHHPIRTCDDACTRVK